MAIGEYASWISLDDTLGAIGWSTARIESIVPGLPRHRIIELFKKAGNVFMKTLEDETITAMVYKSIKHITHSSESMIYRFPPQIAFYALYAMVISHPRELQDIRHTLVTLLDHEPLTPVVEEEEEEEETY